MTALAVSIGGVLGPTPTVAQTSNSLRPTEASKLKLPPNSPFFDPDIIYLEADELINDEEGQILTALGEVEGRYQDRNIRADRVIYNLKTGQILASGNVVIVNADGSSQHAETLELSNALEAGTATNFTSRLPNGGTTGAALATRTTDDGIELFNAYYTACEICEDKNPTWQLKARNVSQDTSRNMIRYKDVFFEFFGVPVFYTPYLAHPDTTQKRASGFLSPFIGISSSKGLKGHIPYFIAVDPYTDVTLTPHLYQKVNPLLGYEITRKFYSGEIDISGSLTYGSWFDRDGNPFEDAQLFRTPETAPIGKRLRSHMFASGKFDISPDWKWGFGAQFTSDDLYLDRYDLDETPTKFGLYQSDSRRLISQIFAVGQDDDFRISTSAYGFQSLRTNIRFDEDNNTQPYILTQEDDSTLPIIAPKIELTKYFNVPTIGGRLKTFGDMTVLTRKTGTDYLRGTAGLDWSRNLYAPGGIEVKPFGQLRYDHFSIKPDNSTQTEANQTFPDSEFSRSLGQVGVDIRWPFIKSHDGLDIIIEPRALITQNFGDAHIEDLTSTAINGTTRSLFEDSLGVDLDQALFWSPNKSTGYDFWQKGLRADIGGSVSALWGNSQASLFIGQSIASDYDNDFSASSGLAGDRSDLIGLFEIDLNGKFSINSRVRFDDETNTFKRVDSGLRYNGSRLSTDLRYYRLDTALAAQSADPLAPAEEISGGIGFKISKDWSTRYRAYHDIDRDLTRRQELALSYRDDCTLIEFVFNRDNFDSDIVRDKSSFGIRIALLTLGDFSPE